MTPYLLLFVALLLIFLEFYLPGGIMAIAGALTLLMSIILISIESPSILEVFLFVLVSFAGVLGVIKLALWHIRSTGRKGTIFLESDQEGYRASSFETELIGKEGIALADMRPGGYVLIEGKKYQALSLSGYIPKGSEVKVISGQGESLHVKILKKETP